MAETIVAPHGLFYMENAGGRMSQRIRRFLHRWERRSVSQAVSLWRTKEAKAGKVAAQWDRPLMRRGRYFRIDLRKGSTQRLLFRTPK